MRRLVSTLGYVFFAVFAISALLPDDDTKSAPVSVTPTLALGDDKAVLLEDVPKQVSLRTPDTTRLLGNDKAALPKVTPDVATYAYVTASRLNVRAGPSARDRKLYSFVKGTKLSVSETKGGWARVNGSRDGTPITGWVAAKFLSGEKPAGPIIKPRVVKRSVAVPSTSQISQARKAIIRQSIANHSGNCACDYQRDRAGRRCGKRSAWSRRGGYVPLCYENEVTQAHLTSYFRRQNR